MKGFKRIISGSSGEGFQRIISGSAGGRVSKDHKW